MLCIRRQQDMPSLSYIISILTVSLDFSIQVCQWQPLLVHLWAYCNPPIAHYMNDAWCMKGRPHHRGNFPYSCRTVVWVLLCPFQFWVWRRQGQWLNVTTQWRNHHFKSQRAWSHRFLTLSLPSRPEPAAKKCAIIPKPAGAGRWNSLCFDALSPPP